MMAFNLMEFVESYTNIGLYAPSFSLFMSLEKWNSLSEASQEAIMNVSGANIVQLAETFEEVNAGGVQAAVDAGLEIVEPSQELIDAIVDGTSGLVDDWVAKANEMGVDGAAALEFYKTQLGN